MVFWNGTPNKENLHGPPEVGALKKKKKKKKGWNVR